MQWFSPWTWPAGWWVEAGRVHGEIHCIEFHGGKHCIKFLYTCFVGMFGGWWQLKFMAKIIALCFCILVIALDFAAEIFALRFCIFVLFVCSVDGGSSSSRRKSLHCVSVYWWIMGVWAGWPQCNEFRRELDLPVGGWRQVEFTAKIIALDFTAENIALSFCIFSANNAGGNSQ